MVDYELATSREVLHERASVLLEHYQGLSESLSSPLAMLAIEAAMKEHKQVGLNLSMVDAGVDLLPSFDSREAFRTKNPGQARLMQASTIWIPVNSDSSSYSATYPYFVIGSKPSDKKGWTDLLVKGAYTDDSRSYNYNSRFRGLRAVKVPGSVKAALDAAGGRLDSEYIPAELAQILDAKYGTLSIRESSPGSIAIDKIKAAKPINNKRLSKAGWFFTAKATHGSMGLVRGIDFAEEVSPTNELLANFDALIGLSDLAIRFGKVAEMDAVFARRLEQETAPPEDPKPPKNWWQRPQR